MFIALLVMDAWAMATGFIPSRGLKRPPSYHIRSSCQAPLGSCSM